MEQPIYLDYNATTPVDESVVNRMVPFFAENFGNPSSKGHPFGWYADAAVQKAREQVAGVLHCDPSEITFTSGATEAINTVMKGVVRNSSSKNRIITAPTEHKAVIQTCEELASEGCEIDHIPVDEQGVLDLTELENLISDETALIAIMWANNETGVVNPVKDISDIARSNKIPFFSDATQAVGKLEVDAGLVDYLACSAHKFYGPKGAGAMFVSSAAPVEVSPLIRGGGQEHGMRSGTLNVPAIVGMGEAAAMIKGRLGNDRKRWLALRDRFESRVTECEGVFVNGGNVERLPQTANVGFPKVSAIKLGLKLRGLAFSAGSACQSGSGGPSHVLSAMGLKPDVAGKCIRFSFGRQTTADDIDRACDLICTAYDDLVESSKETSSVT